MQEPQQSLTGSGVSVTTFGHAPKQLNTVSVTELSQELGDYNFKFASISDAACPVHKATFELLRTVHVPQHTRT